MLQLLYHLNINILLDINRFKINLTTTYLKELKLQISFVEK